MNTFEKFSFEFWKSSSTNMMTIKADKPTDSKGLDYIWFVATEDELKRTQESYTTIQDGYHYAQVSGDNWFFFNMTHASGSGETTIRYHNVTIPKAWVKTLIRAAKHIWQRLPDGERYKIELSLAVRNGILKRYGQGTGIVEIESQGSTTDDFLNQCLENANFKRCYENVQAIARNSTWKYSEKAFVTISKDWDGFFWTALNPSRRQILNGGIINHGTVEEPSWSTHT